MTKQQTAHLDQHVTDGKLKQEQADTMKANLPEQIKNMINNTLPAGGHGGKGFGGLKIGEELFTLLNITQAEFQTESQAGKTLLDIAKAHNVTEQQLTDFFTEQHTAQLKQAVTDGKMTQEQADQLATNLPDMISKVINSKPGDFKGRGKGGMKLFRGGDQTLPTQPQPTQPTQPTQQSQQVQPTQPAATL